MSNLSNPITLPDKDTIERAIKEAIPRDWFATLDLNFLIDPDTGKVVEEIYSLSGLTEGSIIKTLPLTIFGSEVSPAEVQALIKTKSRLLLSCIEELRRCLRLRTASGLSIDAWAYSLWGDSLARRSSSFSFGQGNEERDNEYRQRIKKIIHWVDNVPISPTHLHKLGDTSPYPLSTEDEERGGIGYGSGYYFLPLPSAVGVDAYLGCFGFVVATVDVGSSGVMLNSSGNVIGFFWWDHTTQSDDSSLRPPIKSWKDVAARATEAHYESSKVWDHLGGPILIFIKDQGELLNAEVVALIRQAKTFGIEVEFKFY
jgi:hypothetical protein